MNLLIQFGVAYLVGSVPYGFIFGKWKRIDIRKHGSGNIGATNVWRVLGKGWGCATFFLDFLKVPFGSFVALGASNLLFPIGPQGSIDPEWRSIVVFLAAVMGHNFPVWLGFKGGKGIATSAGGLLWMMPKSLLVVAGVWLMVFGVWRIVGLASVVAAVILPLGTYVLYGYGEFFWFCCGLSLLAILRHRSNIQRLIQGKEHRWGGGGLALKESSKEGNG